MTYICVSNDENPDMKNVRCDTVTLSPSLSFPFCAPLTLFPLFLGVEPLSGKFVQCCEYEHRATPSNIFFSTQLLKMRLASFFDKGKGNFEDWIGRLILWIAHCSKSSWRCRLYCWRTCKLKDLKEMNAVWEEKFKSMAQCTQRITGMSGWGRRGIKIPHSSDFLTLRPSHHPTLGQIHFISCKTFL